MFLSSLLRVPRIGTAPKRCRTSRAGARSWYGRPLRHYQAGAIDLTFADVTSGSGMYHAGRGTFAS